MPDTCYIRLEEDCVTNFEEPSKTHQAKSDLSGFTRPCGKCGSVDRYKGGQCKACHKQSVARSKSLNPEKYREYYRKYREENGDKIRAQKNASRAVDFAANPAKYRKHWNDYRQRNLEQIRAAELERWHNLPPEVHAEKCAYRATSKRQDEAIAFGKASPICRQNGFLLVLCADGHSYRSARADKPLAAGEVAFCSFSTGLYPGTWIAHRAPVVPAAHRALAERTYTRLRKREGEPKNRTGRPSK